MPKGQRYSKKYVEIVRNKFNDLQSNSKQNTNTNGKSSNGEKCKVCFTDRVVVQR